MSEELVLCSIEDSIARVTINRADALNSLNKEVLEGLESTFAALSENKDIAVVILTGAGDKSFAAGADIEMMADLADDQIREYVALGQRAMRNIETCPVPVIAMVNGFALGGGLELALSCDLIIASEKAKVGQPEINLGVIPGFGGTQRLIQRCGVAVSRRLCLTADVLRAPEAQQLGIIDYIAEPDELEKKALKIVKNISTKGPLAVRAAKEVIRRSEEEWLLRGLDLEVEAFVKLFPTSDRKEGMQAFLEKTKTEF